MRNVGFTVSISLPCSAWERMTGRSASTITAERCLSVPTQSMGSRLPRRSRMRLQQPLALAPSPSPSPGGRGDAWWPASRSHPTPLPPRWGKEGMRVHDPPPDCRLPTALLDSPRQRAVGTTSVVIPSFRISRRLPPSAPPFRKGRSEGICARCGSLTTIPLAMRSSKCQSSARHPLSSQERARVRRHATAAASADCRRRPFDVRRSIVDVRPSVSDFELRASSFRPAASTAAPDAER
jgi:hypothetical protein